MTATSCGRKQYDYLVVGSGLYGAVFSHLAAGAGKRCLVLEKRRETGGNIFCENVRGINVHKYGAHIFHTSDREVWDFVNSFADFNRFTNSPVADYRGRLYNLPFNMNTFYALWGCRTPAEAEAKIESQRAEAGITAPRNLEEQALYLGGRDIYETLVRGYTEKQWGRKCSELPAFIIKRLPFRFTFDNNYFDDRYQGIPAGGYNVLTAGLLRGIEVRTETDFFSARQYFTGLAEKIVFTGRLDEFFGYEYGRLSYRTVRFESEELESRNFQGNAVVNYTDAAVPYTRIIEHKHFEPDSAAYREPFTVISREYPGEWRDGAEPFYPVNDQANSLLAKKYSALAARRRDVIFGGRLAEYQYYDMDDVIAKAMRDFRRECGSKNRRK